MSVPERWDIRALVSEAARLYGRDESNHLRLCLQSIGIRQRHAKFHFKEAFKLLRDAVGDRGIDQVFTDFILPIDISIYERFQVERYKVEAHVLALLQSMHALADILAHVIYFALGMRFDEQSRIQDRHIGIGPVHRRIGDRRLGELVAQLISNDDFKYLSAIVNTSKHRSVVCTPYSVDKLDTGAPEHGLNFAAFSHDDKWYPGRRVEPFVSGEFARQSRLIVKIGLHLNDLVAQQ